jgi:hypothetical protein
MLPSGCFGSEADITASVELVRFYARSGIRIAPEVAVGI